MKGGGTPDRNLGAVDKSLGKKGGTKIDQGMNYRKTAFVRWQEAQEKKKKVLGTAK